eukprot:CAMPEP_0197826800 /NCGR_PEP_ID=MMETSP1437-20131217/3700_1 /TAXON_ID=49252 ORGANISM="Eucampia antarctica, Strain CCMP1452" /NCGR_SAMPLE_ID=MMETSP1437 /ASSEMBLY_ACC=CAM_ASM_001096 /LENGTH=66 /DNA_ID=CAMNT_0043427387 /DNA_START=238 /DNA_END=438 /DNA_ORIENTATION=-
MAIVPSTALRTSRTKKSIIGAPIPMLIMLTGTFSNVPVYVKKPRLLDRSSVMESKSSLAKSVARSG